MDSSIINILNTCTWICLAFTVLFFLVSIALFFILDIKNIFNIITGRAKAKTVKEMKAANESTGRLRVGGKTQTSKLTEEEKDFNRAPAVIPPTSEESEMYYGGGTNSTTVLSQQPSNSGISFSETTVLTEDIQYNSQSKTSMSESVNSGDFKIIKNVMIVHTQVII